MENRTRFYTETCKSEAEVVTFWWLVRGPLKRWLTAGQMDHLPARPALPALLCTHPRPRHGRSCGYQILSYSETRSPVPALQPISPCGLRGLWAANRRTAAGDHLSYRHVGYPMSSEFFTDLVDACGSGLVQHPLKEAVLRLFGDLLRSFWPHAYKYSGSPGLASKTQHLQLQQTCLSARRALPSISILLHFLSKVKGRNN